MYGLAVDNCVPPEAALNQANVAPVGSVALKTTVPVPQRETSPAVTISGTAFTVAFTAVLVVDKHPVVVFLLCA